MFVVGLVDLMSVVDLAVAALSSPGHFVAAPAVAVPVVAAPVVAAPVVAAPVVAAAGLLV